MLHNCIQKIEREVTLEQVLKACHAGKSADGDTVAERWFCPLRRCAGDRHPHFIIDRSRAIDQYGKPIDFSHHINKDIIVRYHWQCQHTRTEGFGSFSLLAAVIGITPDANLMSRADIVRVISEAHDLFGIPVSEIEEENRNGWLLEYQPIEQWQIRLSDSFQPEALRVLGVEGMDGVATADIVDILHRDFGLYQVEKYTTSAVPNADRQRGGMLSYERRCHALFPVFAFCYDAQTGLPLDVNPEKREQPWVARIVMPAFTRRPGEDFDWKSDFWTAFSVADARQTVREFQSRFSLFGDTVAMQVSRLPVFVKTNEELGIEGNEDYDGESASDICERCNSDETIIDKKEEEVEEEKMKDGKPTGKFETVIKPVPMKPLEKKLNRCVLCLNPLDAVCAYLWLNYPRLRLPDSSHSGDYWHVVFLRASRNLLNVIESSQLRRTAIDVFELFGNDRDAVSMANTNALRNDYLRLCMLPTSMSEMDKVDGGVGIPHIPHTPIDFFRYYVPTLDEEARNMLFVGSSIGVKALMLQKQLTGSSALKPFTRVNKKKKQAGEKGYTYEMNIVAAWQLMINKGYCRYLLPNKKRDRIGQCVRIDGHFIYELDPDSVMADMRTSLEDFAKDNATDPEDADMMMNAMLRCKDLQYSRNITKLPLIAMPKSESYAIDLDYFFFRNCALEITPKSIIPRSYDDLDFLVYRSEVLPFDYYQPFYGNRAPISIRQSDDYAKLERQYQEARVNASFDDEAVSDLRQRLRDMDTVGRWEITIRPTDKEVDSRIVVPRNIREDDKHNEWLRWWPFLRLLRCLANEHFKEEEAGRFVDGDRTALMARMANLMFTIGRCIFRYRGVQYMPYFLENTVDREGKAQGGSGKSVLVEHFMSFVRYVCNVDGKSIKDSGEFAKNFSNYEHHKHTVVHIEDFPKMPIDPLFNYATNNFVSRSLFENPVQVEHSESPNIVITSNFMVQSTDESALGRVQFGGLSHYFSREVAVMNKEGRKLDTIMPDIHINGKPSDYDIEQRSQIIYVMAVCLQFTMVCTKLGVQVAVPGADLLERLSRTEMGDSFYDWFTSFLSQPWVYNSPIAINEIFNEYRRYLDPSKARIEMVSRTKFYENLQKYCAKPAHGVLFMPIKPFLTTSEVNRSKRKAEDGSEKSYLRKGSSWFTRSFVDDKGKLHYARVLEKNAGEGSVTGGAVWFSQRGKEPKSAEEFQQLLDQFAIAPDPAPILDENEQPVTIGQYSQWTMLNTEEEAEIIRKSGGVRRSQSFPTPSQVADGSPSGSASANNNITGENIPDSLPF